MPAGKIDACQGKARRSPKISFDLFQQVSRYGRIYNELFELVQPLNAGRGFGEKLGCAKSCGQAAPMTFSENELQKHYRLLVGGESPWRVNNVKLELNEKRVEIELTWTEGAKAQCQDCPP